MEVDIKYFNFANNMVFVANSSSNNIKGNYSLVNVYKKYSFDGFSSKKIYELFRFLSLDESILNHKSYTLSEKKRLNLAYFLLTKKKVLVLDHFFLNMNQNEIKKYMRIFRELIYRAKIKFLFLEDDMNIIAEYSKSFYLFYDKQFHLIYDYYDDRIYKYVEMPYTVSCIKYFNKMGHDVDREITFDETLKAIYRSVV